jgi:serine protease Do
VIDEWVSAATTDLARRLKACTVRVVDGRGSCGSGTVVDRHTVITNAHVVASRRVAIEDQTGRRWPVRLVALDQARDLAELRSETPLPLDAAELGTTERLRSGHLVFALGNPLGLRHALAVGIVHRVSTSEFYPGVPWVQADIRLAPGNSGGPLTDASGQVVGINAMIAGGLGLAIPVEAVESFLKRAHPESNRVDEAILQL